MGRQKSGTSLLSRQWMLEIKTYKTVWTMGHKIRKALADRDAHYQLAGLIEMDDTYFGAPKSGKRYPGAAGKAKMMVAVETPENKLKFAAMRLVPTDALPLLGYLEHYILGYKTMSQFKFIHFLGLCL
jgi:hypothetical protein